MIKRVGRICIAVPDLDAALAFYRDALGLVVEEEIELPDNGLKLVRLPLGETVIELMQPTTEVGPIADFLRRSGTGLHHIALEVDDIDGEVRTLIERGVQLFDQQPRDTPGGRTAFVQPRSAGGVMIELNQAAASDAAAQANEVDAGVVAVAVAVEGVPGES